jgi:hypothetical protein
VIEVRAQAQVSEGQIYLPTRRIHHRIMQRRTFLSASGVLIGLSGCVGGDDGGESGESVTIETDSPTAVVESWHRFEFEASLAEKKRRAGELFHDENPRLDAIQSQEIENVADNEIDDLQAEVVDEGLTDEQLEEVFVNGSVIEAVAAEPEAPVRVRATYQLTTEGGFGGEAVVEHIVGTENGEWQILRSLPQS